MLFEIKKDVLTEALGKVSKVVSAKASIPILQGFLVEVGTEDICFTGSNGNDTIRYSIPVDGEDCIVSQTGKIIFPYQVESISKKLNKSITFELDGFSTKIKSGKSEFDLNCMDAEEYPKFQEIDLTSPTLTLTGEQFQSLVKKTAYAASKNETRPILQGVCFHTTDSQVELVCTDSHRLGKVSQKADVSEELRIVVPAITLDSAMKVFGGDEVQLFLQNEQSILLKSGSLMYLSRLLQGTYPDTSRLVPKESQTTLIISREELFRSLDMIKEIANAGDNGSAGTVKLHLNGEASLTSTQSQKGKGKIDVPYTSLEGDDDFSISFSCQYALDALKTMTSDEVEISFSGNMKPFIIRPVDEGANELQLILPVRTY